MKILIIEDEGLAARRLEKLLKEINPAIQVTAVIDSIEEAVEWLIIYPHPELIFMDIMLADGQSFEVFERVEIMVPVIFTTAYDEFAIKAFKVNSIDYLLKPIEPDALQLALKKFETFSLSHAHFRGIMKSMLNKGLSQESISLYKKRFLIKTGDKFVPVAVSEAAYFCFIDKLAFLVTGSQKRYMLDYTLDELETMLDPQVFFRLNRQYISSFAAIKLVHNYFNGKMKIQLAPEISENIVVSKERAPLLKSWLNI